MLDLTPSARRERVADSVLKEWQKFASDTKLRHQSISTRRKLKREARTLREAHRIVTAIAPLVRSRPSVPMIKILGGQNDGAELKAPDLLGAGGLLWIADWLDAVKPKRGMPAQVFCVQAAGELAEISRRTIGKPDWRWVAQKLKDYFPVIGDPDDRGRYIQEQVKKFRHRKRGLFRVDRRHAPGSAFFAAELLPENTPKGSKALSTEETIKNAEIFFTTINLHTALLSSPKKRTSTQKQKQAHELKAHPRSKRQREKRE